MNVTADRAFAFGPLVRDQLLGEQPVSARAARLLALGEFDQLDDAQIFKFAPVVAPSPATHTSFPRYNVEGLEKANFPTEEFSTNLPPGIDETRQARLNRQSEKELLKVFRSKCGPLISTWSAARIGVRWRCCGHCEGLAMVSQWRGISSSAPLAFLSLSSSRAKRTDSAGFFGGSGSHKPSSLNSLGQRTPGATQNFP